MIITLMLTNYKLKPLIDSFMENKLKHWHISQAYNSMSEKTS